MMLVTLTLTGAYVLVLSALSINAEPSQYSTSVYTANYGSIGTIQTCTTQYCSIKPPRVSTLEATIHRSSTATVKKTKTSTCYVTKKNKTKRITKTTTKYCTTTGKAKAHTIYSTRTVRITSVRTLSVIATVTTEPSVITITAPDVTVPTPDGFINVEDDPDNAESLFPTFTFEKLKNRAAQTPHGGIRYPKVVKCRKTLQTTLARTHTITSKTTSIVYGRTLTVTSTKKATKTVYPQQYGKTTTITRIFTSTLYATSTETSTTTITSTKQSTAIAPRKTVYAACNPRNLFGGPTGVLFPFFGSEAIEVDNARTAEECCVACQSHVNGEGVSDCVGSYIGILNDGIGAGCFIIPSAVCGNPNIIGFAGFSEDWDYRSFISNGPCGRWKLRAIE